MNVNVVDVVVRGINSITRFGPISYEKRSSLSVSSSDNPATIAVSWPSGEGA